MEQGFSGVRVTEPSGPEPILLAWDHVHSAASPELRRWLITTKPLNLHQDALMVAAPNNFTRTLLEGRFRGTIEEHLTDFFERPVQLAVIVDDSLTPLTMAATPPAWPTSFDAGSGQGRFDHNGPATNPQARPGFGSRSEYATNGDSGHHPEQTDNGLNGEARSGYDDTRPRREPDARLNPKYTFETFVIGSSNRFAHAAAIAVAESPGKSYNPLHDLRRFGPGQDPSAARARALRTQLP